MPALVKPHTDTHTHVSYVLLFQCNNVFINAPQCYVITYIASLVIYIINCIYYFILFIFNGIRYSYTHLNLYRSYHNYIHLTPLTHGVPYKTQHTAVNNSFYFYFFKQYQCAIKEKRLKFSPLTCLFKGKSSFESFWNQSAKKRFWRMQKTFHAVRVGFQHSTFFCFDY